MAFSSIVVSIVEIVLMVEIHHVPFLGESAVAFHEPALGASDALPVGAPELPEVLGPSILITALFELVVILISDVVLVLEHVEVMVLTVVVLAQHLVGPVTNLSVQLRFTLLVLVADVLIGVIVTKLVAYYLGPLIVAQSVRVMLLLSLDAMHE